MKYQYKIFLAVAIAGSMLYCKRSSGSGEEPVEKRIQYESSNAIFPNPERGFIKTMSVYSAGTGLNSAQLNVLRTQNVSMILRVIYLDGFKDKPVSNSFLELLQSDMEKIKTAGLKVLLRFAYTDDMAGADAPLNIIEQHLDQLKPFFENNKDIISFVQAGFIGAWGEWHSSSNGLATVENQRTVLNKILSVLPQGIMVQVRTPGFKQQIFNSTTALTAQQAYSNENIARVGHHNDCFLSGGTDYGTYSNVELEKQYISNEALYVPTGGETCPPTGGYDPTCAEGRREMKLLKWTYLNLDWYPATINAWKSSGCFDEFQTNLGYRLSLVDAKFPGQATTDSSIPIDINITNKGYAPLYHSKNTYIVLKSKTGEQYYQKQLAADLRQSKPGGTLNIIETISLTGIPEGSYDLFIKIRDTAPGLQDRIEYAVRLANDKTWVEENNGMNDLKHTITIKN